MTDKEIIVKARARFGVDGPNDEEMEKLGGVSVHSFFRGCLNMLASQLHDVSEDYSDLLQWALIAKAKSKNWCYYHFEDDEDWRHFMHYEPEISRALEPMGRMYLKFFVSNCMNGVVQA